MTLQFWRKWHRWIGFPASIFRLYADKPFLNRLHSGEAFGDGGLVFAMLWAVALFVLTATGLIIYFKLRPRTPAGIQKVFW